MLNLQTNCCSKLDSENVDQDAGDKWLIHDINHNRDTSTSWKACNSSEEYHRREYKSCMKETYGNMFNSIFKIKAQEQKHPEKWAMAELKLRRRNPNTGVQNEKLWTHSIECIFCIFYGIYCKVTHFLRSRHCTCEFMEQAAGSNGIVKRN